MINDISLVAYKDGASAFFYRNHKQNSYHKITDGSIKRLQWIAYRLVLTNKATIHPGPESEFVRWQIKIKEQFNAS